MAAANKEKVATIAIKDIRIGQRKRKAEDVSDLVESISQLGLLQPIVVTTENRLVAGYRRLQACKQLGWTTIPAKIVQLDELKTELAEIDENLVRQELTALERYEHLARRKEIYEALYPNAKPEVQRLRGLKPFASSAVRGTALDEAPTFVKDTAAKTGLSERTIQRGVQIATKIPQDVRDLIRHTPLADQKRELLELARKPEEEQREIAKKIAAGEAKSVSHAQLLVKKERASAKPQHSPAGNQRCPAIMLYEECMEELVPRLGQFDLIIADPPYNVGRCDWDDVGNRESYLQKCREWLTVLQAALKPRYHLFWFCSPRYFADIEMLMRDLRLPIKSRIVWHRRNMSMGSHAKERFIDSWEAIFHCGNKDLNWPEVWDESRFDVQIFAAPQSNYADQKLHPTQKPLALIQWLVNYGSCPGDRVLDPFAGSGTTGEACLGTRECVLIERDPGYAKVIRSRLQL